MLKLVKFDATTNPTYMFPSGEIAPPSRIIQDFPAVELFPHVLEINGNVCQAIMEVGALRSQHNIDPALTEEQAIEAIEVIINTPPPEPEPTAEERIAAAMEYDNLMKY